MARIKLVYKCKECKKENYLGKRNKVKQPDKSEIKKYCPKCNKPQLHVEKNKLH